MDVDLTVVVNPPAQFSVDVVPPTPTETVVVVTPMETVVIPTSPVNATIIPPTPVQTILIDIGPKGEQGEQGIQGPPGPAGDVGISGTGWAHVTGGAFDSVATTPTASEVGADVSGAALTAQGNAETFATSAVSTETSRAETAEGLLVPKTTTVNGHALSGNISITASDVGAVISVSGTAPISSSGSTTPTISISAATDSVAGSMSAADKTKLDAISGTNTGDETKLTIESKLGITNTEVTAITNLSGTNTGDQTLSGLGGVSTSTTVNGHALSGNISITASDVGACLLYTSPSPRDA